MRLLRPEETRSALRVGKLPQGAPGPETPWLATRQVVKSNGTSLSTWRWHQTNPSDERQEKSVHGWTPSLHLLHLRRFFCQQERLQNPPAVFPRAEQGESGRRDIGSVIFQTTRPSRMRHLQHLSWVFWRREILRESHQGGSRVGPRQNPWRDQLPGRNFTAKRISNDFSWSSCNLTNEGFFRPILRKNGFRFAETLSFHLEFWDFSLSFSKLYERMPFLC